MPKPSPFVACLLAWSSLPIAAFGGDSCNAALCTWSPDEVALQNPDPLFHYMDYEDGLDATPSAAETPRAPLELPMHTSTPYARFNFKVANFFRDDFLVECQTALGPESVGDDHPATLGPHAWLQVTGELFTGEPLFIRCMTTLPTPAESPVVQPAFAAERESLLTRLEELSAQNRELSAQNRASREAAVDSQVDHDAKDLLAAIGLASIFAACLYMMVRLQLDLASSDDRVELAAAAALECESAVADATAAEPDRNTPAAAVADTIVESASADSADSVASDVAVVSADAETDDEVEPEPDAAVPTDTPASDATVDSLVDDVVDLAPEEPEVIAAVTPNRLSVDSFEIVDDYKQ